jgi:Tol biopolymer transport system component
MRRSSVLFLLSFTGAALADSSVSDPQIFAPGEVSSTPSEDCMSLTPDGDTAVFDLDGPSSSTIVISHRVKGHWSTPAIASFSGQWMDHDPAVSPDGKFIVFASNRPATADGKVGGGLWRVDRAGTGWGEPKRLPDSVNTNPRIYAPSITQDGSVYFIRPGDDKVLHIFRSQYKDGSYQPAVEQTLGDMTTHQKDPGIAPDESYVVFDSDVGSKKDVDRFFIAFREGDHWGPAEDLGDVINADNNPWGPHIGADGSTLYYTSDRSVKVVYPRSRDQAEKDTARILSWDDGETNIWYVSLKSVIEAHGHKG